MMSGGKCRVGCDGASSFGGPLRQAVCDGGQRRNCLLLAAGMGVTQDYAHDNPSRRDDMRTVKQPTGRKLETVGGMSHAVSSARVGGRRFSTIAGYRTVETLDFDWLYRSVAAETRG